MKLSKIKSNPNNPRIIKDEKFKKLVQSIKDFPEMIEKRPMVCVTDADGRIYPLGGNMRLKALQELQYNEIPDTWVVMADDWTEEKRKEFVIKDNVGFGEWDWDDLANNWDTEKLEEWGLNIPNWASGSELNEMSESDLDINEEFDPIGASKGLTRLVVLFDNIIAAKEWIEKNNLNIDYKKRGNDENVILQVNLSSNYGI